MTHRARLGFTHMDERILHLYIECPEGGVIPMAKRDIIPISPDAMKGREWCPWCEARYRFSNPRSQPLR